ncbi:hypothetical protein AAVH_24117 [Aphelenchoides avenae]|nr:hypothetical protein AAVH_24117 [Aphelenchus avenae]
MNYTSVFAVLALGIVANAFVLQDLPLFGEADSAYFLPRGVRNANAQMSFADGSNPTKPLLNRDELKNRWLSLYRVPVRLEDILKKMN